MQFCCFNIEQTKNTRILNKNNICLKCTTPVFAFVAIDTTKWSNSKWEVGHSPARPLTKPFTVRSFIRCTWMSQEFKSAAYPFTCCGIYFKLINSPVLCVSSCLVLPVFFFFFLSSQWSKFCYYFICFSVKRYLFWWFIFVFIVGVHSYKIALQEVATKYTRYEKWAAIMGLGHFRCIFNIWPCRAHSHRVIYFKDYCIYCGYGHVYGYVALWQILVQRPANKSLLTLCHFSNWTVSHSFLHEVKLTMCHFWYKFEQITRSKIELIDYISSCYSIAC